MDYTLEALSHSLETNRNFNEILFENYLEETQYVVTAMESSIVVMEAVVAKIKDKTKDIFNKIIEFFKRILGIFKEKSKTMVEKNNDWLNLSKDSFKTLNYNGLQLEMVPFWNMDSKTIVNTIRNNVNNIAKLTSSKNLNKSYSNIENVKKELFASYLDENGDISNGAKNFFRVGKSKNADVKPVRLAGNDLRKMVVNEFYPYCYNYINGVTNDITNAINTLNSRMSAISSKLETDNQSNDNNQAATTKESFILENFSELFDLTAVFEAEQPANKNQNSNQSNNQANNNNQNEDKKPSPTKVELQDNANDTETKVKNNISDMSTEHATIIKNILQCEQIVVAAALTAVEERYNAYMNAMRQIYQARKNTIPGNSNNINNNINRNG